MNRICTLRLDVGVDDPATAFDLRQKLRFEWLEKLEPILDASLNKLSTGDRWLHINTLEIKVKLNNAQMLSDEFYHQCHQQLNQLISSLHGSDFHDYPEGKLPLERGGLHVVDHDSGTHPAADPQPLLWDELEIILTYLTSGQLPWFIEASEFKQFLSKEVRIHRSALITRVVNTRPLAVWFRAIDLLLNFADPDWGDELIEQLNTDVSDLTPVFRRMLRTWIDHDEIHSRRKIENILTILAFSRAYYSYEVDSDSQADMPELTASSWQALIESVPDWSHAEQELLVSAVPGVLRSGKPTTLQASDISSVINQATTDSMQPIMRKTLSDVEKGETGDIGLPTGHKERDISVQVDYAGLVILAPFLGRFLSACDVETDSQRINYDHLPKAAALLYALVRGNDECREYDLGFIKIMLGIDFNSPVLLVPGELSKGDFEEIENLIIAVIGHWTAVGNLSVNGFRGAFLERTAMLTEESNGWNLTFDRAGHDVLIDRLPWVLQMVHLPWMQKPIHVNW